MRFRKLPLLAGLVIAASAASCNSNPIFGNAVLKTQLDTLLVYALNGTPIGSPSAIQVYTSTVGRAEADTTGQVYFDLALDIDGAGRILLVPSKLVASDARGATSRVIGLQTTSVAFDAMREAPSSGYKYDSVAVATVGQTVLIDSRNAQCSPYLPSVYAKLVVDSVTTGRVMHVRLATDPNCGFRGLVPGEIPKR